MNMNLKTCKTYQISIAKIQLLKLVNTIPDIKLRHIAA